MNPAHDISHEGPSLRHPPDRAFLPFCDTLDGKRGGLDFCGLLVYKEDCFSCYYKKIHIVYNVLYSIAF